MTGVRQFHGIPGWLLSKADDGTVGVVCMDEGGPGGNLDLKPAGCHEQRLLHALVSSIIECNAVPTLRGVTLNDVSLAAQMLTWGRDEGLTDLQTSEVDAHAARLFAAIDAARAQPAPDLREPLSDLYFAYVRLLESARDRILDLGGTCDPVPELEASDVHLRAAREALAATWSGHGEPVRQFEMTNGQAVQLAAFGGTPSDGTSLEDQDVLVLEHLENGHAGPGLYAHFDGVEEAGSILLHGQAKPPARTRAMPSEQDTRDAARWRAIAPHLRVDGDADVQLKWAWWLHIHNDGIAFERTHSGAASVEEAIDSLVTKQRAQAGVQQP